MLVVQVHRLGELAYGRDIVVDTVRTGADQEPASTQSVRRVRPHLPRLSTSSTNTHLSRAFASTGLVVFRPAMMLPYALHTIGNEARHRGTDGHCLRHKVVRSPTQRASRLNDRSNRFTTDAIRRTETSSANHELRFSAAAATAVGRVPCSCCVDDNDDIVVSAVASVWPKHVALVKRDVKS